MTRGPKTVFLKSSTTLAVCCVAPSCIKYCVCRGKPYSVSYGKRSFRSTSKYRSEFAVSLKKISCRLSLGWTWHPRRRPSFCYWSLHGRSQEVPSHKTACSVCSQSLQNKSKARRNPCVETNLIFSFCPSCELKSRSFVIRKFIHQKILYGNIFESIRSILRT